MMKNNPAQLEMFGLDDHNNHETKNTQHSDPSYLKKIRGYQNLIYILIAFILVSLLSFSLGVEKGKKLIAGVNPSINDMRLLPQTENKGSLPLAGIKETVNKETASPAAMKKEEKGSLGLNVETANEIKIKAGENPDKTNYTIQVASISHGKYVNNELNKLKNKGYSAFSLTKGKYAVICIGRFNAKEEAQRYLTRLKNSYPDCQIRRL